MARTVAPPAGADAIGASDDIQLDARPEPLRGVVLAVWRYRAVTLALARKELEIRYKRTALVV